VKDDAPHQIQQSAATVHTLNWATQRSSRVQWWAAEAGERTSGCDNFQRPLLAKQISRRFRAHRTGVVSSWSSIYCIRKTASGSF
jgi:hypothetical protein